MSDGQVVTTNVGRTDSSSSSSSSSSSAYTDSSSSYTDSSSSKKSGWVSDAYGKQYLDSQGEYITGWKEISGKQYYFDDGGGELSDDEAYEKIIALKDSYPEGMSWTNDNSYQSGYRTGYGCAGFAFMVQDAVFGKNTKKTTSTTLDWDALRVGDHIRMENVSGGEHSVIILSIDDNSITLCEGNYNFSIHWGRTVTQEELEEKFIYHETCY